MVQHYLNVINYAPRGGQFNTGDGIKMAQAVGADLWHMDCYEGLFGLGSVTYPVEEGIPCDMICNAGTECCQHRCCHSGGHRR